LQLAHPGRCATFRIVSRSTAYRFSITVHILFSSEMGSKPDWESWEAGRLTERLLTREQVGNLRCGKAESRTARRLFPSCCKIARRMKRPRLTAGRALADD
jgi:hypothetical protein